MPFCESGRRTLLRNALTLYGVQGCTYLLPLLTYPYLARVLGPVSWGAVLFAQSIGAIIAIGVEYGFDLSATRETARFAHDKARLSTLIGGVLGAKVLLAAIGIGAALLIRPFTFYVAPSPALFWASVAWGVGQGINMLWYFQGLERMTWAGGLDIAGKTLATASIFLLVHRPEDGWKVIAAQAVGCGITHAITVGIAFREVGFCRPRWALVWETLRLGGAMFLFRASSGLASAANTLVLGVVASPAAVAMFGGADKFRQLAFQGLWPINQTLFPHQARNVAADRISGARLVRRSMLLLGAMSLLFGLMLIVCAPWLIRLALGPAFMGAVPALRVLGLMVPLQALCTVLTAQWVLPLGLDREFNLVVLGSSAVSVVAGALLSSRFGAVGMAAGVTLGQLYSLVALAVILRRKGLSPFSQSKRELAGVLAEATKA